MGRLPAPTSRWQPRVDGPPLSEGQVIVPVLDSLSIVVTLPPTLAVGTHAIGLTVDRLGQVVETNEGNNLVTVPPQISAGTSGLSPQPGPAPMLSDAFPDPTRGGVAWLLSLPRPATARVDVPSGIDRARVTTGRQSGTPRVIRLK